MPLRRSIIWLLALVALEASVRPAAANPPDGAALVRLLGTRARAAFAPRGSPGIGALVTLPPGARASDLGLAEAAPGIGRLWGAPTAVVAFADAHPGMHVEVMPPLHLLLDTATEFVRSGVVNDSGLDGTGVLIGIADTGIDLAHPDFLDAQGKTRVAWLFDLSGPPIGLHPELEQQYGSTDAMGNLVAGAVWSAEDIDARLGTRRPPRPGGPRPRVSELPQDEVGHGTLVAACAASNGLQGLSAFRGVAPKATLLVARLTSTGSDSIGNDELLRGVAFLFGRADAMGQPIVVNLSVGTDFGPHDGTTLWEQTLARYVGPAHAGRAIVAAAGNSGSIVDTPVHQNVHISPDAPIRVPLVATAPVSDGGVQIWVAMHAGASLDVGLDGPDGTWITPVGGNDSAGKNTSDYAASIYNGSEARGSPVPAGSSGAVVVWQGRWPAGTYYVTLSGSGTADLYEQGTGDASAAGAVGWSNGVRDATINLPATHPAILGVGCTINKPSWTSVHGTTLGPVVPLLDPAGDMADPSRAGRDPLPGEPCWFSSAGPTLTGLQKPELMAPGAAIVGALSQQAVPPAMASIFTNSGCPPSVSTSTSDPTCQEIDAKHAVSFGTSFSAPLVAGAVAVLLQHDPTLTQDRVVAALQGGAHPLRGPAPFNDQSGAGELDVEGAVLAADALHDSEVALPARDQSWITLGADPFLADGSTPMQAVVELRAARTGANPPPPADGFGTGRLAAYARVDGVPYDGAITSLVRRGPGVWVATVALPAGLGGSVLVVGATFDGADIAEPKSVPIASDVWEAGYPARIAGGCAVSPASDDACRGAAPVAVVLVLLRRRRSRPRLNA
jgi:subtilisin family serine protease